MNSCFIFQDGEMTLMGKRNAHSPFFTGISTHHCCVFSLVIPAAKTTTTTSTVIVVIVVVLLIIIIILIQIRLILIFVLILVVVIVLSLTSTSTQSLITVIVVMVVINIHYRLHPIVESASLSLLSFHCHCHRRVIVDVSGVQPVQPPQSRHAIPAQFCWGTHMFSPQTWILLNSINHNRAHSMVQGMVSV